MIFINDLRETNMLLKFNDRIKALREGKNMSQTDLAKRLGLTRSAVSAWEQGVSEPTLKNLVELSYIFNCSSDYLLSIDDRIYIEVTSVRPKNIEALKTIADSLRKDKKL